MGTALSDPRRTPEPEPESEPEPDPGPDVGAGASPTAGALGVAVVGTGRIARKWHLSAWAARSDARLLWTVDVDRDSAREAAATWSVPRSATDLATVLDDPDVAVVDLCTPPEHHAPQLLAALRAGKHVLVEKPAAWSLAEVRAMAEAAEEAEAAGGPVAMVAENWLHSPAIARLRRLVEGGALGEPLVVAGTLETGTALPRTPQQQRSRLLNGGVHMVTTIRHLFGEPTHVGAFTLPDRAEGPTGPRTDLDIVASLRFADGRIGSFQQSGRSQRPRPGVRVVRVLGTEGMAEADPIAGWAAWTETAWDGGTHHRWQDTTGAAGQDAEIAHFLDVVRGRATPLPTLRDQLRTHHVMEAMLTSARSFETVEIPAA
ncbi:Gfo/Idh/MocA family protein [Streptomyces sp. 6N223]|uniref:Gfo/Idh/MocA family protein n=1 Tax=Streptomyces sp. 6N223 TaxID=3457412 RepID=UPI003FD045FE